MREDKIDIYCKWSITGISMKFTELLKRNISVFVVCTHAGVYDVYVSPLFSFLGVFWRWCRYVCRCLRAVAVLTAVVNLLMSLIVWQDSEETEGGEMQHILQSDKIWHSPALRCTREPTHTSIVWGLQREHYGNGVVVCYKVKAASVLQAGFKGAFRVFLQTR